MKCMCKGLYSINQESAQEQIRKIVQRNNCLYGSRLLKPSTPFTVQAILKVIFNGQWLAEKIKGNTNSLISVRLYVRGIFSDNHSDHVNALSTLVIIFNCESK